MGKTKLASGGEEGVITDEYMTREDFHNFHSEVQKKFDDLTREHHELVKAQSESRENLEKVHSETNSKLDKFDEMMTSLLQSEYGKDKLRHEVSDRALVFMVTTHLELLKDRVRHIGGQ
ncbi:hypothetical protein BRADI_2g32098v3 [Brachypodium distachyon]|uniref:Uncharacterized protein n=1 Tax=Brachypodium distachyon TaxID=15368 RepID=A0A0Q3R0S2_BRADI|nr:hypothetical protein BRADI_2g32098v3 [Brachypodium distachyon]